MTSLWNIALKSGGVHSVDILIKEIPFEEVLSLKCAFKREHLKLRKTRKTVWLGAYYKGRLAGVCAFRRTKYGVKCKSDLVLEEFRGLRLYRRLFEKRLEHVLTLETDRVYAYCNRNSRPIYEKYGFTQKGRRKRYTCMEWKQP